MSLDTHMQAIWYGRRGVIWLLLLPLSALFYLVVAIRRWAFRVGLLRSVRLAKPVIVVGNLTVGGTGKTPLVIWLANRLAQQGLKVGVITRGYGGSAHQWPQAVRADSDPGSVGDEAVLIAQQASAAAVIAGPDRIADAEQAIAAGAQVIISDDGLQHYRLQRDGELVVVDGDRMLGNGSLLPAGPLREPSRRLTQANLVLINRRSVSASTMLPLPMPVVEYRVLPQQVRSLASKSLAALGGFRGQTVHVVTGIGNPQAFISALRAAGLEVRARILPDHARFTPNDLAFDDELPVLMTEKDAVKCRAFASVQDGTRYWVVDAELVIDAAAADKLLATVNQAMSRHASR